MVAISELLQSCLRQFLSLINSSTLADHTEEVPLQEWTDELGRLRVWAANIGAHQTRQSSLDYRLRDASHIKSQVVRLLEQFQELLTDLRDILEESSDDEAQVHQFEDLGDSESENSTTEVQEIHQALVETINQLYQMSMIIRKPAQHDRLVGTKKLDSEPFQFWAKQHTSSKYPNADALAIDRISSAMARQRAILKYRERHHEKLSQGINSESDGKSTVLSETVVTDLFKEIPGKEIPDQLSDMASDAGVSETSYGGTLLEGTGADAPKIPPIPKKGTENKPFECPYCFYIITVRDRRAWARHIFRDLMPYVCIFPECSMPNKLYGGRRQWHHHVQQTHASASSVDGTYDCSICKHGPLPAVTFQRHVGQHLEELALFLLPLTDEDEDENEEGTDESIINVSLDDSSVESVEQRNNMDNTATPASDSNPGEHNPLGEPAPIEITDPLTVVRDLYDDEKLVIDDFERHAAFCGICSHTIQRYEDGLTLCEPGNIRARILRRCLYSQSGKHFSTIDLEHGKSTRVKLPRDAFATRDLLTALEQGMHIREKAKQTSTSHTFSRRRPEQEPEGYHDRTDPRASGESQLLREEDEWSEDETSERLRKPQQFERTHQSAEERKAEEEEVRHQLEERFKVSMPMKDEKGVRLREMLIREEKWKELARQKEEDEEHEQLIQEIGDEDMRRAREAEEKREREDAAIEEWKLEQVRIKQKEREDASKDAAIEEWKLEQVRIKQRETESQSKEFRERLHGMGYTDEEIEQIIHKKEKDQKKEQKEEKNKEPEVKDPNTTWIKV